MTFSDSDQLLAQTHPNFNPTAPTNLFGAAPGSMYSKGGIPSYSNVPPPLQSALTNTVQPSVNSPANTPTGSYALPVGPQTPNTMENPPSSSADGNNDFLKTVRDTLGGIVHGAIDVAGISSMYVARPLYEGILHPENLNAAIGESITQKRNPFQVITEKFENEPDSGLTKFIGEVALDPLSYVGVGEAARAVKIAGEVPKIGGVLSKAVQVATKPIQWNDRIATAIEGHVGDFASGFLNNSIPLIESKNNARNLLGKVLPGNTVESILGTIPDEYTGIPIKTISDYINSKAPGLGLPDILRIPDVKVIKMATVHSTTSQDLASFFGKAGITPDSLANNQSAIDKAFNELYVAQRERLSPSEQRLQDTLRSATPLGESSFNSLAKAIDSPVTADAGKVYNLNQIVQLYRRSPSIEDAISGQLDARTANQALQQLFAVDSTKGDRITAFLQGHSTAQRSFMDSLSKMPVEDAYNAVMNKAHTLADSEWTLGIARDRMQQTAVNSALNAWDTVYTKFYTNYYANKINKPLSKMYLEFTGFPAMNVLETHLRSGIAGGGYRWNTLDRNAFVRDQWFDPNVPPRLFELSPNDKEMATLGNTLKSEDPLGKLVEKVIGFDPMQRYMDLGSSTEMNIQRGAWRQFKLQEYDNERLARGLQLRQDLQAYHDAVRAPDVATDPNLAGLDQKFVNDFTSSGTLNLTNKNAWDTQRRNLDPGYQNREALAAIIDQNDSYLDMDPSSRYMWVQGIRNIDPSSQGVNDLITKIVENEKRIADSAPEAIAAKFQGFNQSIEAKVGRMGFTTDDLISAYRHVNAMQDQLSQLPDLLRQAEYEQVNKVLTSDTGGWRRQIHDAYNKRFQDSISAVKSELDKSITTIRQAGQQYGIGPEMDKVAELLSAQHQLMMDTWIKDAEFQRGFWAVNGGKSKNPAMMNEYYDTRAKIWSGTPENPGYYGQKQLLTNQTMAADAAVQSKLQVNKVAELAARMSTPQTPAEWKLTARSKGAISGTYGDHDLTITKNPEGWSFTTTRGTKVENSTEFYRTQKEAHSAAIASAEQDRNLPIAQSIGEPGLDAIVRRVTEGIESGADPDHIAGYDYNKIANDARVPGEESTVDVSRSTTGEPIFNSNPNEPITAGNNGPSAAHDYNPSDAISGLYARANALGPRLNEDVINVFNNPRMSEQNRQALTSWMDNVEKEYNALPPESQNTLSETMTAASARARQRFNDTFVDYDSRNKLDWAMQHIFPFWMYESRRYPWLAQTARRRPGLAAMYSKYMDQTNQGYIPIGETPFQINPLRGTVLGGLSRAGGPDSPTKFSTGIEGQMEALETTLGKFGLYAGPAISIPSNLIRGQLGASTPPSLDMVLNIAHASGMPIISPAADKIEKNLLPDPFRDYYTRMILASQKQEPDKIYADALGGDETAMGILDAAGRQADLVNLVLQQTGVLRFRTPEYTDYQNTRMAAIHNITGLTIPDQMRLRDEGKTINQVSQLTPAQQEQMNALDGTKEFSQISMPLLSPAAQQLRGAQVEFYDALAKEREDLHSQQSTDDSRLQSGIISGVEWRKRYENRAGDLAAMFDHLKQSERYKNVPVTAEEQDTARKRFNLPAYVDNPISNALNQYYAIKPETDVVTGDVNWPKFYDDRQAIVDKYPMLQAELDRRVKEKETFQVQDFKEQMKVLRPYFGIEDAIIAKYPQLGAEKQAAQLIMNQDPIQGRAYAQNDPNIKMLNTIVRQYQQAARRQFPQIDAALVKYYGASPIQYQDMQKSKSATGGLFGKGSASIPRVA
jgi:hypothetical protein